MVIMGDYSSPCDRNILQQSPKKMPKTCFQDGIDGCLIVELPHISIYFHIFPGFQLFLIFFWVAQMPGRHVLQGDASVNVSDAHTLQSEKANRRREAQRWGTIDVCRKNMRNMGMFTSGNMGKFCVAKTYM
jgi:hypothetical protein